MYFCAFFVNKVMGEEKYLGKKGYQGYKHYARFMNRHQMYRMMKRKRLFEKLKDII